MSLAGAQRILSQNYKEDPCDDFEDWRSDMGLSFSSLKLKLLSPLSEDLQGSACKSRMPRGRAVFSFLLSWPEPAEVPD